MPKRIEVEGVVTGKVGGEGDNWGKQHKNVGGVEMKFSRLASCLYFESPAPVVPWSESRVHCQ